MNIECNLECGIGNNTVDCSNECKCPKGYGGYNCECKITPILRCISVNSINDNSIYTAYLSYSSLIEYELNSYTINQPCFSSIYYNTTEQQLSSSAPTEYLPGFIEYAFSVPLNDTDFTWTVGSDSVSY